MDGNTVEPQLIDLPPRKRGSAALRALLAVAALVGALLITAAPVTADTVVTVEAGDSLSEIALAYDTTVAALMAANGITNPDRVYMGQRLVVPGPGSTPTTLPTMVVVVQRGDSLSGIAAEYGVTLSALIEANNISVPTGWSHICDIATHRSLPHSWGRD